ncbi:MAG: hypothetical protein ABH861_03205 [Patescibacteria group bacterium]
MNTKKLYAFHVIPTEKALRRVEESLFVRLLRDPSTSVGMTEGLEYIEGCVLNFNPQPYD